MSQHEEYTSPPGFRISGGGGTKLAPVLIDPAAPASEGDVITRVGTGYAPQAASGGGSGPEAVEITLTSDDLKALHNTPFALVVPTDADETILPLFVSLDKGPSATPYTVSAGTYFYVGHGTTTNGPWNTGYFSFDASTFLRTGDQRLILTFALGNVEGGNQLLVDTTIQGKALAIQIEPSKPITLGTGTLTVRVVFLRLAAP